MRTKRNCRRLGKARERLLEATGDYAFPPGSQLDEITGLRKQTRVRDLQFKVGKQTTAAAAAVTATCCYCWKLQVAIVVGVAAAGNQAACAWFCRRCTYHFFRHGGREGKDVACWTFDVSLRADYFTR